MTVEHRVQYHICGDLGDRPIGKIEREELQSFLDRKAAKGLSFSTVDHLQWDLHQIFSLAVDEERQELYVGVQHPPEVAVYRKGASGNEKPLRSLQGESTRLSDVHGVVLDQKKQLMLVTNWGHVSDAKVAGTGRFEDPSITVYPMGASGDTSPIRVIQGSRTQLNWPAQMALDPDTGDIYVANDIGHSVLVFKETDQGNAAPTRVIKGNRTGLLNPSGVFVDQKHHELWVANFGNSSAVVYPLDANGNVAPIRTIVGGNTRLVFPTGIAVDAGGRTYVANKGSNGNYVSVTVYAAGATGNARPRPGRRRWTRPRAKPARARTRTGRRAAATRSPPRSPARRPSAAAAEFISAKPASGGSEAASLVKRMRSASAFAASFRHE